jgi:hypothetical protein
VSTTYFTWTLPSPDCEAGRTPPLEKVWVSMQLPEAKGHVLFTASRNMWLTGTLATMTSHLGIRSLDFLSDTHTAVQKDSTNYKWIAVMLDRAAVIDAIAGIELLLHCATDKPETLGALLPHRCPEEDIREALKSSSSIPVPVDGGNNEPDGEEEGDGPVYLFSFLKCLRSLLGHAQTHRQCLIHLLHIP